MRTSSTLSIHVGPKAHHIGSLLWDIRFSDKEYLDSIDRCYGLSPPKCVFVDQVESWRMFEQDLEDPYATTQESLSSWSGNVQTVQRIKSHQPASESSGNEWRRRSTAALHDKSKLKLSTYGTDIEGEKWISLEVLDRLRYFAEASDAVDCIDIHLDPLMMALLPDIMDEIDADFGSLVTPLWVFDSFEDSARSIQALQLAQRVSLLVPVQQADPLDPDGTDLDRLALRQALALHIATSHRLSTSGGIGNAEWCAASTYQGSLTICSLEEFLCWQSAGRTNTESFGDQILSSFSRDVSPSTINPFAKSHAPWSAGGVTLTNVVSVRGGSSTELAAALFRKCFTSNFRLSYCSQLSGTLSVKGDLLCDSYNPDDALSPSNMITLEGGAASVGTQTATANYLQRLLWENKAKKHRGGDLGDLEDEVFEFISSKAECYGNLDALI
eukprot:gene2435-2669_t